MVQLLSRNVFTGSIVPFTAIKQQVCGMNAPPPTLRNSYVTQVDDMEYYVAKGFTHGKVSLQPMHSYGTFQSLIGFSEILSAVEAKYSYSLPHERLRALEMIGTFYMTGSLAAL